MPRIRLEGDTIAAGRVRIGFQRTLRIPDDGRVYPLPPGLGEFPIRRVREFSRRVPARWRDRGGYFIPMYQREALWIMFRGEDWRPSAVKVGVGGVNAVSGARFDARLRRRPQDYLVVPEQPWLDGINAGAGFIRQFVAMPLGAGYTVEAQLTGKEEEGGIQITVVEPKPGRFPSRPRSRAGLGMWGEGMVREMASASCAMGLGAGGRMAQKIYPDRHGPLTWDGTRRATVHVHIANSEMYRAITGGPPPATPISAQTYTRFGLPWFALYDEDLGDVPAPESLAGVKPVGTLEAASPAAKAADEDELVVPPSQVVHLEW